MRLTDLGPSYRPGQGMAGSTGRLDFKCPRCRLGVVCVDLVEGEQRDGAHGCNQLPPDFETISITPSVADEGLCRRCPGWHGHITNGAIVGGI